MQEKLYIKFQILVTSGEGMEGEEIHGWVNSWLRKFRVGHV